MIRILVDSASDYSVEEAKQKNIRIVPLGVSIGGASYKDGVDLNTDEFYELLVSGKGAAQTSQPSPQDFLTLFEEAKENGDELICILLSSALSGTYQSALLAKNMADYDGIYLIDSLSATLPIKIMADYAYRLAEEGVPAAEIAEKVEELKPRVRLAAALDTLEYLKRGGRIGKAAAAIGELANLKPIITLTQEGSIGVLGKCLGKNKAFSFLLNHLKKEELDESFPLYSVYTYGTANCDRFESKLAKESYTLSRRLQAGCAIGTHVGPEAFGVIYVTK